MEKAIAPELGRIHDGKRWRLVDGSADAQREGGASVVRLTPNEPDGPGSHVSLALVEGLEFGEGTLEVDLKGNGEAEASFLGVAFDVSDAKTFEAVYFRPFNFKREGDSFRAHAVQYVAWPEHTWEKLRAAAPGVYEAPVRPVPDPAGWFHARVEVTPQKVRVWVDDGKQPCLVVDRFAGRGRKVGLWVDSKVGAFRNLTIRPAK